MSSRSGFGFAIISAEWPGHGKGYSFRTELLKVVLEVCEHVVGAFRRQAEPRELSELQGRVAEEVIDGEELGKGAGVRVGGLRGQDGVPKPLVFSGSELAEERLVEDVGGVVESSGRVAPGLVSLRPSFKDSDRLGVALPARGRTCPRSRLYRGE